MSKAKSATKNGAGSADARAAKVRDFDPHRSQRSQRRRLRRLDRAAGGLRIRRQRHGGDRQGQGHEVDRAADEEGDARECAGGDARAAKALRAGDLFFLTYSGHGGQVPDVNGDEDDKRDETWCLYDGQVIDDELYLEFSRFAEGVRILVLSDSCHSGTVARGIPPQPETVPHQRPKLMPESVAMRTYRDHKAFYDKLQRDVAAAAGKPVVDPDTALAQVAVSGRLSAISAQFKAQLVLISGCQDNQTSMDGDHNGAFTEQVLNVWNHGKFSGNYASFHARVKARMPATQSPNLFALGSAGAFLAQTPFSGLTRIAAAPHSNRRSTRWKPVR